LFVIAEKIIRKYTKRTFTKKKEIYLFQLHNRQKPTDIPNVIIEGFKTLAAPSHLAAAVRSIIQFIKQ